MPTENIPQLSIVVPVYRVEPYLAKCIDSILAQTLSDFELILVDDGSPDRCGAICDEYAAKDPRIQVIHKANGGLSSARNAGIDIARGKYLGFVDSDDWIEPIMYATLMADLERYQADVACCSTTMWGLGQTDPLLQPTDPARDEPIELWDHETALRMLITERTNSAWSKLYRSDCFKEIRFPEGRINEDFPTLLRIFSKSNRVSFNSRRLYNYYRREASITTSSFSLRQFDELDNCREAVEFIRENHPALLPAMEKRLFAVSLKLLSHSVFSADPAMRLRERELFRLVRGAIGRIIRNPCLPWKQKLLLCLASGGRGPSRLIFRFYQSLQKLKGG
jgi:glycosyltransferase involved in cell wall biosynthesis